VSADGKTAHFAFNSADPAVLTPPRIKPHGGLGSRAGAPWGRGPESTIGVCIAVGRALETALVVSAEESGATAVEVAAESKEPGSSAAPSRIYGRLGGDQAGAWVEVRQRRRGKRNCERPSENDALPTE